MQHIGSLIPTTFRSPQAMISEAAIHFPHREDHLRPGDQSMSLMWAMERSVDAPILYHFCQPQPLKKASRHPQSPRKGPLESKNEVRWGQAAPPPAEHLKLPQDLLAPLFALPPPPPPPRPSSQITHTAAA